MTNNLGNGVADAGRFDEAGKLYLEASQLAHEVGDRSSEALAISNLGYEHHGR